VISPLDSLVVGGLLKKEPPDADEFLGLIRSGTVRLADAGNSSLSLESRFDLAYQVAENRRKRQKRDAESQRIRRVAEKNRQVRPSWKT